MMSDSILTDLGSLFFFVWSAVIAGVSIAAFGRDLLPSRVRSNFESARRAHRKAQ
ncbi:MAG TPA: hypothetical protein VJQ59_10940 [Candidatus Sulfotelmatobacter sp.]|nr:hypothetical protein [Candidatus Sulfotelmatobacter sp.]